MTLLNSKNIRDSPLRGPATLVYFNNLKIMCRTIFLRDIWLLGEPHRFDTICMHGKQFYRIEETVGLVQAKLKLLEVCFMPL